MPWKNFIWVFREKIITAKSMQQISSAHQISEPASLVEIFDRKILKTDTEVLH